MAVPPQWPAVAAVLATLAIANVWWGWRDRRQTLARLRREWATPVPRVRDMDAIASYHRARATPDTALDDRTWRDLDLDAVYATLDRTSSRIGQQRLYHRLRSRTSEAPLSALESLVSRVSTDVDARERSQLALTRLQRTAGYELHRLTEPGTIEPRRWHVVSPILAVVMIATAALSWTWGTPLVGLTVLLPACLAMWVVTTRRMRAVIEPFRLVGPLIAVGAALQYLHHADHADLTTPLLTDLPHLGRLGMIAGWLTRDVTAMDPISGTLLELLNFLLALDDVVLWLGALELRQHAPALGRVWASVGDIDVALAIASFRAGTRQWCRPSLTGAGTRMAVVDLRHPLLPQAVPNTLELGPPHGALFTGSNMSGKSTLLRSLGVAVVMSQTVGTCVAASTLPRRSRSGVAWAGATVSSTVAATTSMRCRASSRSCTRVPRTRRISFCWTSCFAGRTESKASPPPRRRSWSCAAPPPCTSSRPPPMTPSWCRSSR